MPDSTSMDLSFDPDRSRFLLVGVGHYTKGLEEVPNAYGNLERLKKLLLNKEIVGVSEENIRVLIDPRDKAEFSEVFLEEAKKADDLLFFYYVGHGLPGRETGRLYLATVNSSNEESDHNGFDFEEVRLRLTQPQPAKRIILLDCCFAGMALDGSLGTVEGLVTSNIDIRPIAPKSSYAIASAGPNRTADAGTGQPYTAFTGELIDLLENGTGSEEPVITMERLFSHLEERIRMKPTLPKPMRRQQHDGGALIFARNHVGTSLERQMSSLYRQIGASVAAIEARLTEVKFSIEKRLDRLEAGTALDAQSSGRPQFSPLNARLAAVLFCCVLDAMTLAGLWLTAAIPSAPPSSAASAAAADLVTMFLACASGVHILVVACAVQLALVARNPSEGSDADRPILGIFPRRLPYPLIVANSAMVLLMLGFLWLLPASNLRMFFSRPGKPP